MNLIIKNIEEIRKRKGITKSHISKYCGKSTQWYSDISRGRRRMYVDDLPKVAEAMGEDVKNFFNNVLSDTRNKRSA